MMLNRYTCPHCGEEVSSVADLGGGEQQTYVEDCPVCCRPNVIQATYRAGDDDFDLVASAEGE